MQKLFSLVSICLLLLLSGCAQENPGTILFTANGEDFVRRGFTDKDGWQISFDRLYVNIVNPTAYEPAGEKSGITLAGEHLVDLAAGGGEAPPITLGKREKVRPANYQSLKFSLKRAGSGDYAGCSIIMTGRAEKDGKIVPFTILLDEEMDFIGTEGYVGDRIKGLLKPGASTDVEMTFHFDHIFGDIEAGDNDHINTGSVGFDYFNRYAREGRVEVRQAELQESPEYIKLLQAVWTLGHLGEGHCDCLNQSSWELIHGTDA